MFKLIALVTLNILMGNMILLIISSNWFLSSLLIDFRLIFHIIFTTVISVSIVFLVHLMDRLQSRFFQIVLAFLLTISPVVISCWLVIGYAFANANDILSRLIFAIKLGSIIGLTLGAFFWIPFGLINFWITRKEFILTSIDLCKFHKSLILSLTVILALFSIVGFFYKGLILPLAITLVLCLVVGYFFIDKKL